MLLNIRKIPHNNVAGLSSLVWHTNRNGSDYWTQVDAPLLAVLRASYNRTGQFTTFPDYNASARNLEKIGFCYPKLKDSINIRLPDYTNADLCGDARGDKPRSFTGMAGIAVNYIKPEWWNYDYTAVYCVPVFSLIRSKGDMVRPSGAVRKPGEIFGRSAGFNENITGTNDLCSSILSLRNSSMDRLPADWFTEGHKRIESNNYMSSYTRLVEVRSTSDWPVNNLELPTDLFNYVNLSKETIVSLAATNLRKDYAQRIWRNSGNAAEHSIFNINTPYLGIALYYNIIVLGDINASCFQAPQVMITNGHTGNIMTDAFMQLNNCLKLHVESLARMCRTELNIKDIVPTVLFPGIRELNAEWLSKEPFKQVVAKAYDGWSYSKDCNSWDSLDKEFMEKLPLQYRDKVIIPDTLRPNMGVMNKFLEVIK